MSVTLIDAVAASESVHTQIRLVTARIASHKIRYGGATSADDLAEYMEDREAAELADFIADSQAELAELIEAANEMRTPFLSTEEQAIFTDEVLAGLTRIQMYSLLQLLNQDTLYWRIYRLANKTQ